MAELRLSFEVTIRDSDMPEDIEATERSEYFKAEIENALYNLHENARSSFGFSVTGKRAHLKPSKF